MTRGVVVGAEAASTTRGMYGVPRVLMVLVALAAWLALLLVVADAAEATHYRYGSLSWEPTESENEVRFTGAQAWRTTFWYSSPPPVGAIHTVGSVSTGDGGSIPMRLEIVQVNEHHDWFYGIMVDGDGNPGIPYTYSAPNDEGEPWEVEWSVCCRISPYSSGNHHVNNPDHRPSLNTLVDLDLADDAPPQTNVPPIIPCVLDEICEIPIQHIGGKEVSYRMATPEEMGESSSVQPGPPHAPNAAAIDPENGVLTWNTTDAQHDSNWNSWQTLYSTQVMLESGSSKAPVDFFIRIVPDDVEIPYWDNPEPTCGTTKQITSGQSISFDVQARSDDGDRTLRLGNLGLPAGASFSLPDPANPVTGTFDWTPQLDQVGEYLLIFTVEDDQGMQAPACVVTIGVAPGPHWESPDISCGATRHYFVDEQINALFTAKSSNESRLITLDHMGLPTGATFPIPPPANPVSSTFQWTPGVNDIGNHTVGFIAVDDHGAEAPDCVITLQVRIPPHWTDPDMVCGAQPWVVVGETFAFQVEAVSEDEDRVITLGHKGLPDGAQFSTGAADNPASGHFTWTPSMGQGGLHEVVFTAVDDLGVSPADCVVTLEVREPRGQAMARGLWAGTAVPVSLEYSTDTVDQRGEGSGTNLHTTVDRPDLGLYAQGFQETAQVIYDLEGNNVTTLAHTKVALVELLEGLIVLEGLEQEATLTWDLEAQEHRLVTRSEVASVTVAGEEVVIDGTDGPVEVPLLGDGSLVLFERSEQTSGNRTYYHENLVHLYAPLSTDLLSYSRSEVILGSILLQAGGIPDQFPYLSQERLILSQDDAGSGENAGDNPDDALRIGPGLYHGSTPPGDRIDYYEIDLEHGEKIQLAVQPAARAKLTGGGLHLDEGNLLEPDLEVPDLHESSLERYDLRLFDPTGTERERSNLALAGVPQRIELNADLDGAWHVRVERMPQVEEPEAYNYTLGVSVTPVLLLPDEPMFNGADACGAPDAPELLQGVHPKTMQHDDFMDVYRFSADIGDLITVTMKPGETLDGWDAALTLYDEDCQIITRLDSPLLGDLGYSYKGAPRVITELPSLYTGDYYVEVERLNGIGNYYLGLTVTDPFPQVPLLWDDQDPPENHQDADEAPPVFFQGDLHDDNPGDAYLLPFEEGKQAFVAVKMSAMSTVDVKLYRPDGSTQVLPSQNILGGQFVLFNFEATQTGDYGLEIRPTHGGGTYGVTWGQSPVENQDPDDLPLP